MDEDERAVQWAAKRRRRSFLVSGTALGALSLIALVTTLLGVHWAAAFFGGFAPVAAMLLLMWRGEGRAARDRTRPLQ